MKHELLIEKRKLIVFASIIGSDEIRRFKFILDTGASKTIIGESIATTLGFDFLLQFKNITFNFDEKTIET